MNAFKYKTLPFEVKGRAYKQPITERETFASVCKASDLSGLKSLFPTAEEAQKNPDFLYVVFDLAVINQINANGDGILAKDAVEMAKNVKFKQLNVEHSRENLVGVLTGSAFSKYGTNEIISEQEALKMTEPFNLSISAVIWKVVTEIDKIIEECTNPESDNYMAISTSWELGFSDYGVAIGSRNLGSASLKFDEDSVGYAKCLKSEGGNGFTSSGQECYRIILNPTLLGAGITANPAANVKGILTMKNEEKEVNDANEHEMMPEMQDEMDPESESPEMEDEIAPESESPEMDDEMEDEMEDEHEKKKMVKIELEIEVCAAEKSLNKPFRLPSGSKKKFGVFVKNDKGNVVTVKFGDPNMEIKRDDPNRRKAYRSRHGCDVDPGPKWKANYWSCKMWSDKPVSEIVASAEEDLIDYKEDLSEMIIGSISVIQKHAEDILRYSDNPVVKENLSEPFLQGMAALAEDYVSTIHNYVIYSKEPLEMEDEQSVENVDAGKMGLWENIREKKRRMGKNYKPAKPGSKDYPNKDAYKKAQADYEWDGEEEFSQAELLSIDATLENSEKMEESNAEKNIQKNENKISISEKDNVNNTNIMKFNDKEDFYAHLEAHASEAMNPKSMRAFIEDEINKANDQYIAEQESKAASEEALRLAVQDSIATKALLEELQGELQILKEASEMRDRQECFDARFSTLAETYNIEDPKLRSLIAKQIKDLDEEGFASWCENDGLVILAGKEKQKQQVNAEDATKGLKEACASVDIPNAQNVENEKVSPLDPNDILFTI